MVYYDDEGNIQREENYKDGIKDGRGVMYDEEGNITDEVCGFNF